MPNRNQNEQERIYKVVLQCRVCNKRIVSKMTQKAILAIVVDGGEHSNFWMLAGSCLNNSLHHLLGVYPAEDDAEVEAHAFAGGDK